MRIQLLLCLLLFGCSYHDIMNSEGSERADLKYSGTMCTTKESKLKFYFYHADCISTKSHDIEKDGDFYTMTGGKFGGHILQEGKFDTTKIKPITFKPEDSEIKITGTYDQGKVNFEVTLPNGERIVETADCAPYEKLEHFGDGWTCSGGWGYLKRKKPYFM